MKVPLTSIEDGQPLVDGLSPLPDLVSFAVAKNGVLRSWHAVFAYRRANLEIVHMSNSRCRPPAGRGALARSDDSWRSLSH